MTESEFERKLCVEIEKIEKEERTMNWLVVLTGMSDVDLGKLKSEALSYPEPLRTLILTAKDHMADQEFLPEFLGWRKIAKTLDTMKKDGKKH